MPIPLGKSSSPGHSCEAVASKEEEEVAKVVGKALKKSVGEGGSSLNSTLAERAGLHIALVSSGNA